MPIPTKAQPTKPRIDSGRPTRSTFTARARSDQDREQPQKTVQLSRPQSDSSSASSSLVQARGSPQSPVKDASSPTKPTRLATRTFVPPKPSASLESRSSRTTSTLSTVSKPISGAHSRNVSSTTGLSLKQSGHNRIRSTNLTTTSNPASSQIARTKPTSSLQPGPKSVSGHNAARTVSTSSASSAVGQNNIQPSASRLKDELYQLQILHKGSYQTLAQYQNDIEQKVKQRRELLRRQQDQILELESQNRQALSIRTLDEWLRDRDPNVPSGPIQQFSSAILELDRLSQDSELETSLNAFQEWLSESMVIREERKSPVNTSEELKFVRSLGHQWQQRMKELQQQLRLVIDILRELSVPDDQSGIAILASRQLQLANTLLQEVETALTIEKAIMQAESVWETEQLRIAIINLTDPTRGIAASADTYTGIWTK